METYTKKTTDKGICMRLFGGRYPRGLIVHRHSDNNKNVVIKFSVQEDAFL
jgi:hypothetical protein